MNAPFGIVFLKKAELYNLIRRLDKQAADDEKDSINPNTWPVERMILKWTYKYHKHLGTPMMDDFFKSGNRKLKDWGLADINDVIKKEYKQTLKFPDKIRENMTIKGFADFDNNPAQPKNIIINKEGLLLGEVIYNVECRKFPVRWIYRIYSILIDYVGAWILLLFVIIPTIIILIINLINLFCK